MPSKTIEEFLKSASKEQRSKLDQLSQSLQKEGVENRQEPAPVEPQTSQALAERADVQQINQDWQQGRDVKIETVSEKSDLMLANRNENPSTSPHTHPTFMDEQGQQSSPATPGATAPAQQPPGQGSQPPRNAVQEVQAADARREHSAKSSEPQKSPSPTKVQEPER